jgi:hypothetical protein
MINNQCLMNESSLEIPPSSTSDDTEVPNMSVHNSSRHKGTAAGRQTTGQAVALGRNPAQMDGEGLGTTAGARC